jgi:uncharacterized protein with ParB-like and HNH nuclease domain
MNVEKEEISAELSSNASSSPPFSEDDGVDDEAGGDGAVAPVRYSITSFGVDYDVEGAVRRMRRGDIKIPSFQRNYVWNIAEASRLVESLLLGLPVPGIFLASEAETKHLLVIDGQQRLKSLQFFYDEAFAPQETDANIKKFKLTKVQKHLEGKSYSDLTEDERRTLDNSVLHATVVKQDSPENDDTGMYHIFERLNTGGRKLVPQEIRTAVYHGRLNELLSKLNSNASWRDMFGPVSPRLKDHEMILRFLAFRLGWEQYSAPMTDFLSRFAKRYRNLSDADSSRFEQLFTSTIEMIHASIGKRAFRIARALNAAIFDSVMVVVSEMIGSSRDFTGFSEKYDALLRDQTYKEAVSRGTANETSVELRIRQARDLLS